MTSKQPAKTGKIKSVEISQSSYHTNQFTGDSQLFDKVTLCLTGIVNGRDEHYLVCLLDIRQESRFSTGYEYPKAAFTRQCEINVQQTS